MVLIGNYGNEFTVEYLRAGFGVDSDWIPYEYLPKLVVDKKVVNNV